MLVQLVSRSLNLCEFCYRSYSFHEMSPRQRREELKNLLLVMRNTDMASMVAPHGSATSLLPETMQVLCVTEKLINILCWLILILV